MLPLLQVLFVPTRTLTVKATDKAFARESMLTGLAPAAPSCVVTALVSVSVSYLSIFFSSQPSFSSSSSIWIRPDKTVLVDWA